MVRLIGYSMIGLFVLAADVMPSCGKREPHVAQPGDACGGPFVCNAPATCATLDQSITMPNYSSSYVCTKACATDTDCTGLGIDMQCTGTGRLHGYAKPTERVCIPVVAKPYTP